MNSNNKKCPLCKKEINYYKNIKEVNFIDLSIINMDIEMIKYKYEIINIKQIGYTALLAMQNCMQSIFMFLYRYFYNDIIQICTIVMRIYIYIYYFINIETNSKQFMIDNDSEHNKILENIKNSVYQNYKIKYMS
tara:strand:- start:7 stop:411 length:405 start_codon:yes stop_codon:yes gene_type:complete